MFMLCFGYYLGTGIVATVDTTRTGFPSIYHVKCEVLVSQGNHRCNCCKKHRKSLCAMAAHDLSNDKMGEKSNDLQFKCSGYTEEVNELIVSVPVSAYIDSPASSVESLQRRLRSHGVLSSGIYLGLCATDHKFVFCRMDR